MMRRPLAALAALSLAIATIAPAPAFARDRGEGWRSAQRHYGDHYDGRREWRGRHRHHDDDGAAIAAGIVGLALGALIVSAASAGRYAPQCYDNYRRCAPPQPDDAGYEDESYYYEQDDAPPPPAREPAPGYAGAACVRQVRQYDPYSDSYVWVNLRTAC